MRADAAGLRAATFTLATRPARRGAHFLARASVDTKQHPVADGASSEPTKPKVARIVFVGKEHACDCTRKTVDAGSTGLRQALGTPAKIPVERLQLDTQAGKVAPYQQQQPMMALPAIYFVDGKDMVLDVLQGEITTEPDRRRPAAGQGRAVSVPQRVRGRPPGRCQTLKSRPKQGIGSAVS